jgi:hypothetical protein
VEAGFSVIFRCFSWSPNFFPSLPDFSGIDLPEFSLYLAIRGYASTCVASTSASAAPVHRIALFILSCPCPQAEKSGENVYGGPARDFSGSTRPRSMACCFGFGAQRIIDAS